MPVTDAHEPRIDRLEDVLLVLEALRVKLVGVEGGDLAIVPAGPNSLVALPEPNLDMQHVMSLFLFYMSHGERNTRNKLKNEDTKIYKLI